MWAEPVERSRGSTGGNCEATLASTNSHPVAAPLSSESALPESTSYFRPAWAACSGFREDRPAVGSCGSTGEANQPQKEGATWSVRRPLRGDPGPWRRQISGGNAPHRRLFQRADTKAAVIRSVLPPRLGFERSGGRWLGDRPKLRYNTKDYALMAERNSCRSPAVTIATSESVTVVLAWLPFSREDLRERNVAHVPECQFGDNRERAASEDMSDPEDPPEPFDRLIRRTFGSQLRDSEIQEPLRRARLQPGYPGFSRRKMGGR